MKPNCNEMSWEEIAVKLNEANNILAQDFNKLNQEYSGLLMQVIDDEALRVKKNNRGKTQLKPASG